MATAADDGLIRRNPCRIKGAGQEDSPERPVVPLSSLVELLNRIPVRYRAMLLLATFASLRFGELAALQRGDIDLDRCFVRVVRSLVQMNDGELFEAEPKSRTGRRVVSFPRGDRAGAALALGALRGPRGRQPGLCRPEGRPIAPVQLP
jgi:integrase